MTYKYETDGKKPSAHHAVIIDKDKEALLRVARAGKEWHDVRQNKGAGTRAEFVAFLRFAEALKEVEHRLEVPNDQ